MRVGGNLMKKRPFFIKFPPTRIKFPPAVLEYLLPVSISIHPDIGSLLHPPRCWQFTPSTQVLGVYSISLNVGSLLHRPDFGALVHASRY